MKWCVLAFVLAFLRIHRIEKSIGQVSLFSGTKFRQNLAKIVFRIFWASDVGSSACRAINISVLSFSETCEFPIESGVHGHLCSHAFVKMLRS